MTQSTPPDPLAARDLVLRAARRLDCSDPAVIAKWTGVDQRTCAAILRVSASQVGAARSYELRGDDITAAIERPFGRRRATSRSRFSARRPARTGRDKPSSG